jgi:hypothetical protein
MLWRFVASLLAILIFDATNVFVQSSPASIPNVAVCSADCLGTRAAHSCHFFEKLRFIFLSGVALGPHVWRTKETKQVSLPLCCFSRFQSRRRPRPGVYGLTSGLIPDTYKGLMDSRTKSRITGKVHPHLCRDDVLFVQIVTCM